MSPEEAPLWVFFVNATRDVEAFWLGSLQPRWGSHSNRLRRDSSPRAGRGKRAEGLAWMLGRGVACAQAMVADWTDEDRGPDNLLDTWLSADS